MKKIGGKGSRTLSVGFNDIWTTNPNMALQLLNPKDGYKYMQRSSIRLDWKCLECGEIGKNRVISDVSSRGLSCSRCSDKVSFPEKFMYKLLRESKIDFKYDIAQSWSGLKRYDFYLPDYNWIIEVHGEQHFKESFSKMRGKSRTLKEEQENDRLKETLARKNSIDNYIVIDARESTVEWMKNSILNSDIMKIIEEVDFIEIGNLARNNLIKEVCYSWKNEGGNPSDVANRLKLPYQSVLNYLKTGAKIGWCDYGAKKAVKDNAFQTGLLNRKCTVQLSEYGIFIKEWKSATDAGRELDIERTNISACCRGKHKVIGGFRWMYKEDYDVFISNQKEISYSNTTNQ